MTFIPAHSQISNFENNSLFVHLVLTLRCRILAVTSPYEAGWPPRLAGGASRTVRKGMLCTCVQQHPLPRHIAARHLAARSTLAVVSTTAVNSRCPPTDSPENKFLVLSSNSVHSYYVLSQKSVLSSYPERHSVFEYARGRYPTTY